MPAVIRPAKSGLRGGRGAPSSASSTLRGAHTSLPLLEPPLPAPTGDRGESVVARITVARDSPVIINELKMVVDIRRFDS